MRKNVYDFSTFMRFQALTTIKMGLIMKIKKTNPITHAQLYWNSEKKPAICECVNFNIAFCVEDDGHRIREKKNRSL